MNNKEINKNEKSVWKIISLLGLGFLLIEFLNSLFFQTTNNKIVILPLNENYGNQFLFFKLIILTMVIYLIKKNPISVEFNSSIIWFFTLINSIILRYNYHRYYTLSFLIVQFIITFTSFLAFRLKTKLKYKD